MCVGLNWRMQKFGEILERMGAAEAEDVARGLRLQEQHDGRLGEILVQIGVVTPDQVLKLDALQEAREFTREGRPEGRRGQRRGRPAGSVR